MPDHCTSCGKEYTQHVGIIGTCAELQQVKAECDSLRNQLNACANALWCAEDQWGDDYLWKKWKLSEPLTDRLKNELSNPDPSVTASPARGPTVTMLAEIAEAYEEVAVVAEYQCKMHHDDTVEMLGNALEKLRKLGVFK